MAAEDYVRAMRYEMLIRNAYDCRPGMRNGAHQSFMQNAMSLENGETFAKHLGTFEKQFQIVKKYVDKALLKLTKTKPFSSSADYFDILHGQTQYAGSTEHLMDIVDKALDKVVEIRENLKNSKAQD